MADFPTSTKVFLTLQDGVDLVVAQHPNERGDEITAIETLIGALGSAQAYSDSLKNLLRNFVRGCAVEYKGAADLYVRSGEIAIPDASGNVRLRRNTADLTVDWTDIDTGAEANSTVYYVYAVADASGTNFTALISTSASAPTGATYYHLIGVFYNNSSGNIVDVASYSNSKLFGAWGASLANNTVYLADSEGLVIAWGIVGSSGANCTLEGYSDSANPPTEKRASQYFPDTKSGSICFPVMRGDYFKVIFNGQPPASAGIFFIPISRI